NSICDSKRVVVRMASSSKVETNNSKSGAIDEGILEEMKSLLHEFERVETELGV
ncbi:13034_t:CDS:1, partial [Gigaspora margarita]